MPMRTHKHRPHIIATRITKATTDGNGSQTIATKWKPHVITGFAYSGGSICTRFLCGENGAGTMRHISVGADAVNSGYGASDISVSDVGGNKWSATVAFGSKGYTITWTKGGAGLDCTFEFIAIRAKSCWYQQITNPGAAGTEDYTGAGFDPNVVFDFSWRGANDPSTGWGHVIANWVQDSTYYRTSDNIVEASHSWVMFRSGSLTGWWGGGEGITDGFSVQWGKTGAGGAVTVDCWALDFGDIGSGFYVIDPVHDTDVISGEDFTPIAVLSGSNHDSSVTSGGIHTENGQICFNRWGNLNYHVVADSDARRLGQNSSNYRAIDLVLSYGIVNEQVAAVGAPGAGGAPGPFSKLLAMGENSRLGGVG